jgi:hypothetical protein
MCARYGDSACHSHAVARAFCDKDVLSRGMAGEGWPMVDYHVDD